MGENIEDCLFIFDWSTCNNYFEWFFDEEEKTTTEGCALYDLHISSVMSKLRNQKPLIIVSNTIAKKLTLDYTDRGLVVDTFLEAIEIKQISDGMSQTEALIKLLGISDVTKKKVYIVTSDSFIYNLLKSKKYNTINLSELALLMVK